MKKSDLLLYAVTDRRWLNKRTLKEDVIKSLKGGATTVQLREKNLNDKEFLKEALEIKKVCKTYKVPFIVNDNVLVAIKSDADGVHVGQTDCNPKEVREKIGKDKILGVSAQTAEQAILAEKAGADYLGVGAVFSTNSKDDADYVDKKTLTDICNSVSIPVIAIGGINKNNICELKGTGIVGIAVISAIYKEKNIKKATRKLKKITKEIL